MTFDLETYKRELVESLSTLDEGIIRAFCVKYGMTCKDWSGDLFWAVIHKVITGHTCFDMALRSQSKRWLLDHGMHSLDDGDVPV